MSDETRPTGSERRPEDYVERGPERRGTKRDPGAGYSPQSWKDAEMGEEDFYGHVRSGSDRRREPAPSGEPEGSGSQAGGVRGVGEMVAAIVGEAIDDWTEVAEGHRTASETPSEAWYAARILEAVEEARKSREAIDGVRLIEGGPRLIQVIKEIRWRCGLSLRMAKDLTDARPVVLPPTVEGTATDLLNALTELGARVEAIPADTPLPPVTDHRARRRKPE